MHARQTALYSMYVVQYDLLAKELVDLQKLLGAGEGPVGASLADRVLVMLRAAETSLKGVQGAWVSLMEAIEDVSYLERVKKMGEGDLRMLTEVITKLKSGAVTRRKGEAQVPAEKAGSMGASAAGRSVRPKLKLDTLALLSFSREALHYPEFRRDFNALLGDQGFKDEVFLLYLKKAPPREALALLTGLNSIKEAWSYLDDRYGDDQQQVRAIYEKLVGVELRGKNLSEQRSSSLRWSPPAPS